VDQGRSPLAPHTTLRRRGSLGGWANTAAAIVPLAFFGVFFAYPIGSLIARGLGGTTGAPLGEVIGDATNWRILWFTVWQAAVSAALTLLVGLPAAWAVGRNDFRGRGLVRALVVVPFVMPTVVMGAALRATFARTGLDDGAIRLDQTIWAILLAHVVFNVAVVVRVVGGWWSLLDQHVVDAAKLLGANRRQVFREVTVAHLKPALWAAALIVFLFSFTSFGVILVVGGPTHPTLETEIWRHATQRTDFTAAAALAAVQLVVVLVLIIGSGYAERRTASRSLSAPTALPRPRTPRRRVALATSVGVTLAVLLSPLVVLIERSLSVGAGYGLAHYRALADRDARRGLLVAPVDAVRNSLVSAAWATAIAVIVGVLASLCIVHGNRFIGRLLDAGLLIPLGTSAVTLGFGILLALDTPPLDLRTSRWIVPIVQAIVGAPFVTRTIVPILRAINERLREAAAVLGASRAAVRREIDLPIVGRALAGAAAFAFAISLGEFGATAFVARPDHPTVPVAIFRLLGQPGSSLRGQAMALGVILTLCTVACVVVIEASQRANRGL
jgi:thiamine transport system permease protein